MSSKPVQQLAAPVFGQMQADGGGAAGDGGANVNEIAVAIGARPQNRVGKDDGVALGPGDLGA